MPTCWALFRRRIERRGREVRHCNARSAVEAMAPSSVRDSRGAGRLLPPVGRLHGISERSAPCRWHGIPNVALALLPRATHTQPAAWVFPALAEAELAAERIIGLHPTYGVGTGVGITC